MPSSYKECFKCNKAKPITSFYKHRGTVDGHLNKCKECNKKDAIEYRNNNIEKVRAYDRARGYRGTRGMVYNQNSKPAKGRCNLCNSTSNLEKHHPDYDKPKFIIILCRTCHRNTHSIIRLNTQEISDIAHYYTRAR